MKSVIQWFSLGFTALILTSQGRLAGAQARPDEQSRPPSLATVYHAEPDHLWNRLFATFYHQKIALYPKTEENWVGPDVLDPPIGYDPKFLLANEPFRNCDAVLDEFLSRNGAALIRDPLKRAMMQRDLWAVFDVLAQADGFPGITPPRPTAAQEEHRTILERKLAQAIHALALSRAEIESLPDTYNAAIESGAFTDVLDTNRYNFLPPDLVETNSGWHEILPAYPDRLRLPPILQHALMTGGRSNFRAFLKLPAGSKETNILRKIVRDSSRDADKHLKLPFRTQFVLLRELICLDDHGEMAPTHIVESVQYRTFDTASDGFLREAELSRVLLFQGRQGGLRPVLKGEPRVALYGSLGHLHNDGYGDSFLRKAFPENCADCHAANKNSLFSSAGAFSTPARSASIEAIAHWKQQNGKLDLLRRLMLSPASERR